MTEVMYLHCDGVDCFAKVPAFPQPGSELEKARGVWTRNDMDADFCASCSKAAADLEANQASPEDVQAFADAVGGAADKVIEAAETEEPAQAPPLSGSEFEKAIADIEKQMIRDMKKQKQKPDFIKEAVTLFRENAMKMKPKQP